MSEIFGNFINGEWVDSSSGKTFKSVNPANIEEEIASYQVSTVSDVKAGIEAAKSSQTDWSAIPAPQRGTILIKAAELLEQRTEKIASEMTREEGKTIAEAKGEVGRSVNILRYFGGEGARFCGETIPSERAGVFSYTFRKPLGVVSLLTPWNFPIAIPVWKIAPALISGNSVVIKPASAAPILSLIHI